jgi:hypothetical protein
METMIQTRKVHIPLVPKTRIFINRKPEAIPQTECQPRVNIEIPERGSTGPVKIGTLLEPIRQIINHPDRNRLMAEFFKDYK